MFTEGSVGVEGEEGGWEEGDEGRLPLPEPPEPVLAFPVALRLLEVATPPIPPEFSLLSSFAASSVLISGVGASGVAFCCASRLLE